MMSPCPHCGTERPRPRRRCPGCGVLDLPPAGDGTSPETPAPRGTWNDPSQVTPLPSAPMSTPHARTAHEEAPPHAEGVVVVLLRGHSEPTHPSTPLDAPGGEAVAAAFAPEEAAAPSAEGVERTGTHPRARRGDVLRLPEPERSRPGASTDVEASEDERPRDPGERRHARRPPVLASESLREELLPAEPGRRLARAVAGTLGLLGAPAMLSVPSPASWLSWWNALLLLGAALAAVLSIGYARRAAWLLVLAIGGLATNTAWLLSPQAPPRPLDMGLSLWLVPIAAGGLMLRAMHRASRGARLLVLLGVLPLLGWLLLSGALTSRSVASLLDGLRYGSDLLFGAAATLGLLAFMNASTKAAADWLALLLWGAYTLRLTAGTLSGQVPLAFAVAAPLFSAIGALGLSERLAWRERREADRNAPRRSKPTASV